MGLLNRGSLLKREDLKIEKVDLGNEEFIFVRQMTGRERDQFEKSLFKEVVDKKGRPDYERNLSDFRAKLAVNTVCDEKGNMLLNPDDYEQLSKSMSAYRLEKIVNAAQKLNNITDDDKEGLVKNSGGDQPAASNSGLQKN